MRVLATTVPGWGHLVPLLGVLHALRDAGHDVTVATHPDFHPTVARFGLAAEPAGLNEEELLAERRRRWPHTIGEPPEVWAPRMFADIAGPALAADLDRRPARAVPDLVLSEEGEHGGRLYAQRHGAPVVVHHWGGPGRPAAPAPPVAGCIEPCPASLRPPSQSGPPCWAVRAGASRLVDARPETLSWLAARPRPVALVSFGTVPLYRDVPELLPATVRALLAADLDVLYTAPGADTTLPEEQVRHERFVSLPDVVPACAVVVCHGGVGTTLAALAHGVPLVIQPRGAPSQARMAHACRSRGVAEVVEGSAPHALTTAARRALGGDHARHAAAVAREIATAPAPDQVVRHLEAAAKGRRRAG